MQVHTRVHTRTNLWILTLQQEVLPQNTDDSHRVVGTTGCWRCVGACQWRIWDSEVPYYLWVAHMLARAHSSKKPLRPSFGALFSSLSHYIGFHDGDLVKAPLQRLEASGNSLSAEWGVCACVHVCECLCDCKGTFWPHALALTSNKQKASTFGTEGGITDGKWREKKLFFWSIINPCSGPSLQTRQRIPTGTALCDCVVLKFSNIISSHFSIYVLRSPPE